MGIARVVGVVAACAAFLSGCEQKQWTREEIEKIALDAQPYEGGNTQLTIENDVRLKEADARIDALQRELDALRTEVKAREDYNQESVDRLFKNDMTYLGAVNEVRVRQGLPPLDGPKK